jgi:hypothetical protein
MSGAKMSIIRVENDLQRGETRFVVHQEDRQGVLFRYHERNLPVQLLEEATEYYTKRGKANADALCQAERNAQESSERLAKVENLLVAQSFDELERQLARAKEERAAKEAELSATQSKISEKRAALAKLKSNPATNIGADDKGSDASLLASEIAEARKHLHPQKTALDVASDVLSTLEAKVKKVSRQRSALIQSRDQAKSEWEHNNAARDIFTQMDMLAREKLGLLELRKRHNDWYEHACWIAQYSRLASTGVRTAADPATLLLSGIPADQLTRANIEAYLATRLDIQFDAEYQTYLRSGSLDGLQRMFPVAPRRTDDQARTSDLKDFDVDTDRAELASNINADTMDE